MKKSAIILCLFLVVRSSSFAQSGNSLSYDGVNDYVLVGDNNTLDLTGSYTLECWFKVNTFTQLAGLISKNQAGGSTGYTLRLSGTAPYTGLNFDGLTTANGILEAGVWYHVSAVNNGGTRKLYLNGLEQTLTGTSYTTTANSEALTFGVDFLASPRFFNGNIDEITLFNVARTQAEIQSTLLTWPTSFVIATYRCNQGAAGGNNAGVTQLNDQLNISNGTLLGFALNGSFSNWVNSLSMTLPFVSLPTNVTFNSFTANWSLQGQSSVDEFWLDVSTDPNFGSFLPGYNHLIVGTATSYPVTVPSTGTYYYRVYGNKFGVGKIISDIMTVNICGLTKIFVNQSVAVSGDGSSWANAYKELRDALPVALSCMSVDSVLVASGNYRPTNGADRSLFFGISRKIKIYGGYASNGSGARDVVANPTYLDANIATAGSSLDNSYHVMAIAGVPAATDSVVLDGLTFQNGYNNGVASSAIYNGQTINNYWGAGVILSGNTANILFRQCSFAGNSADAAGGAIATVSATDVPSFINCSFASNSAGVSGGAIFGSVNLLTNCTFTSNNSDDGGAIELQSGTMTASGCTFTNNTGFHKGGAIIANGPAVFTNSSFTGNTTTYDAGAVYNNGATLSFTSCSFTSNGGNDFGGAISNAANGTSSISGCTFTSNSCKQAGGAIYLISGKTTVRNSVFNNNSVVTGGLGNASGGAIKATTGSNLAVYANIFQGNVANAVVGGIYNGGWGGAISTLGCTTDSIINNVFTGNICYQSGPIGASGGGAVQVAEGNNYVVNNTFNGNTCNGTGPGGLSVTGAVPGNHFIYNDLLFGNTSTGGPADYSAYVVVNAGNNSIGVDPLFLDAADPDGADNIWGTNDDGLKLKVGSPALDAGDNSKVPAYVTTDVTGGSRIINSTVDIGAYEGYSITKLYVNQAVPVSGDGSTWANALKEVREATALAASSPLIDSILVAAGTYKPTATTDRNATFEIARGGLKIFGGYASNGSGIRDIVANPTYLDGDIGITADTVDNSYNVMRIHDISSGADSIVVDGFSFRNGNGNYVVYPHAGGGINIEYVAHSKKTSIRNCSFINNYSSVGGAIYILTAGPQISHCNFTNNFARFYGGGIGMEINSGTLIDNCQFNSNRSLFISNSNDGGGAVYFFNSNGGITIDNCSFTGNITTSQGGAIGSGNSAHPGGVCSITNCSFNGNQADDGGALSLGNTDATLTNNSFSGNTATATGGAIFGLLNNVPFRTIRATGNRFENNSANYGGAVRLFNLHFKAVANIFRSNTATNNGAGAIHFDAATSIFTDTLINNIFIQNKGVTGVGSGGAVSIANGTGYITNNTFYKDTANNGGAIGLDGGTTEIFNNVFYKNYSSNGVSSADDISGSYAGAQNSFSFVDPLFVNENDPDGPDNIWATNDDGLKLSVFSPAVNAGDNTKVPANITTDITGGARIQNTTVDRGAYEGAVFNGNKLYVNQSAAISGDGMSWAKPLKEFRDAMPFANTSTQIDSVLVAAGTYKTTTGTDRTLNFEITRGKIKMYGGYASSGNGTRDIVANPTYLDGEINTPVLTNNTIRLLYVHDLAAGDDSVVVDGFTVRNSYGNGVTGSGLFVSNVANAGKTSFRNCTFTNCTALFGAGGAANNSSPSISNCSFTGNNALDNGGGLFLQNCSNIILSNCTASSNTATNNGGGIYTVDCSTATFNNCMVSNNIASGTWGGGLYASNGRMVLNTCNFSGNSSALDGGGFYCGGSGEVTASSFTLNTSNSNGGGAVYQNISTAFEELLITNSVFTGNMAGYGGAVRVEGSGNNRFTATGNVFNGNISQNGGGGAINYFGVGNDTLINNVFLLNKDITPGGHIAGAVAVANGTNNYFVNNTFYKDTANNAGAIAVVGGSNVKFYNNIFYKNYSGNGVTPNNDISGPYTGSNNIFSSTDPSFANEADPDGADNTWGTSDDGLALLRCSYAVNRGDNTKIPSIITTDITGSNRIFNVQADVGAYELQAFPGNGSIPTSNTSLTQPVYNGVTSIGSACSLIALIEPNGGSPVSGNVDGKVWIEGSVPQYLGEPFVARHYEITPANNPSTATAKITLFFTQAEFDAFNADPGSLYNLPANPTDALGKNALIVIKFAGTSSNGSGLPASYSGSVTTIDPLDADIVWNAGSSRWEVSFTVSGFSGFIVKTTNPTLPVSLVSFTGRLMTDKKVNLEWKVADQQNIQEYIVERSTDAMNFIPIGRVTANSQSSFTYDLTDANPVNGNNFYRLRIVETSNQNKFSQTVRISLTGSNETTLYPNPARDMVILQSNKLSLLNSMAWLTDMTGRMVKTILISQLPMKVDIISLPAGSYFLKTTDGNVFKIIKQ